jgi:integrase/recombinase XerD
LKPTAKRTNRVVFFDDEVATHLKRWLKVRESRATANYSKDSKALWVSSWGSKVDRGAIVYVVDKAARLCGLHDPSSPRMEDHFSAHCARHFFSTHLLRSGMRREYVKWLRGDAIKEAVDIYFHINFVPGSVELVIYQTPTRLDA